MKPQRFSWYLPVILSMLTGCGGDRYTLVENPQILEIGIPVKSVNWVRLHETTASEGSTRILATMGQTADNLFVLDIDPGTGECRQFISTVPESNYPTATMMSRTGRLYIGAAYAGHLLSYDPVLGSLNDLGAINPGQASFPCAIDEDAEGRLWIGSYGTADLTCYDPSTGTFTRHGRMDEVDMYNYPMVNSDGTVCCRIMMTRPHLVVFDPRSGRKKTVGPVTTKGEDSFTLLRGPDNHVYIRSSLGNFRIEGFSAIPVDTTPDAVSPPSKSGLSFSFSDANSQLYHTLEVRTPQGDARNFALDYDAAGTDIFYLHTGPDGCLYGSSILPLHLFRYDPQNGGLTDMGKCSEASGEAYSMANLDGKLYIASYPGARVSLYDPGKPYNYGESADHNPRELGRIDNISYRPRSSLAGPLGRVWFASIPDYGRWGGPLSWYDPRTGEKNAYRDIAGVGSCYTLAWLESLKLLAVGTTISGGTGTQPKVDQAVLFLWDYTAEQKIWEGTLDRPAASFNALAAVPDGRLFGTVTGGDGPELFVFDPSSRTFVNRITLPGGRPLDLGLQNGPDGYLYGFTTSCFYRIDTETLAVEEITREDDAFDIAGPIIGNTVFFAKGSRLMALRIFSE